ncbi:MULTISPECIES: LysR substrate-binding domain-containing protein [unclassified Pseudomonas]|uniref:LysR substrate-binding domain-containing protein n=1 Tax=unclassified Pseudomonas TaxID=196821 RepID=UPI001BCFDDD6|nr:LysR substrate-binding domain-containing protein [Pseudomonas sp. Pc102]BBP83420.1 transcriptional regulator [Pseudomonas sp. Pc102]
MDLTSLEIFRAVADEQSVTRAAQHLQRVQSNVTTRIKQLEDELGVHLFLRDGKRMTLTDKGREFLAYAERLLALAAEARQSMHPDVAGGTLRLGSMESTAASRLPPILARYHRAHPGVALEVSTGTSQALIEGVLSSRIDCALVAHPDALRREDLDGQALERGLCAMPAFNEELVMVLPPDHPPAASPGDIRVGTLACFARGCTYRMLAERWLAGQRTEGTPVQVREVGSYHAILACVSAGDSAGIVPRSVLSLYRESPAVTALAVMPVDTLLVWREGYATAAFQRLREAIAG